MKRTQLLQEIRKVRLEEILRIWARADGSPGAMHDEAKAVLKAVVGSAAGAAIGLAVSLFSSYIGSG